MQRGREAQKEGQALKVFLAYNLLTLCILFSVSGVSLWFRSFLPFLQSRGVVMSRWSPCWCRVMFRAGPSRADEPRRRSPRSKA